MQENKQIELKPCPVCGKLPKIKRDYSYEECGFGAWCTIQCKPFLRKPHLKIEEGKASWERALKYGIEHWNNLAEDIAELKKKYIGEDKNVTTKESEDAE